MKEKNEVSGVQEIVENAQTIKPFQSQLVRYLLTSAASHSIACDLFLGNKGIETELSRLRHIN